MQVPPDEPVGGCAEDSREHYQSTLLGEGEVWLEEVWYYFGRHCFSFAGRRLVLNIGNGGVLLGIWEKKVKKVGGYV